MTTQTTATAAPAKKKGLSRAVKAGAVITMGALLLGSAGSLAGWSQTVKGQDTAIQAGTMSIELTGAQTAFDVTSGAATAIPIDVASFRASPGDVIRVVEPMTITVDGDNLKAKLKGTAPGVSGELPVTVTTSLVDGEAGGTTDLAAATVVASTETANAAGAEAIVDLGSGADGPHAYSVVQEITVPLDVDLSAAGLGALVSGSSWELSQYRGEVEMPEVLAAATGALTVATTGGALGKNTTAEISWGDQTLPEGARYALRIETAPGIFAYVDAPPAVRKISLSPGLQLPGLDEAGPTRSMPTKLLVVKTADGGPVDAGGNNILASSAEEASPAAAIKYYPGTLVARYFSAS